MVENIIIWLTPACFAFIFICILSIMDHKEKAKVERIAKEELANGIENRWVVTGFYFCIYIDHENERYYLNKDGNFYTSDVNAEKYFFNSKEDQIEYIKLHKNEIKEKYPGAKIESRIIRKCIGRCKVLEVV